MADVYALDSHNNYVPTMSKEDILAAIQTAAAGGSFEGFDNTAFVSRLKEINKNSSFSVWVGTQAEYNAVTEKQSNVLYLITDDPLCDDLPNAVDSIKKSFEEIETAITKQSDKIGANERAIAGVAAQTEKIEAIEQTVKEQGEIINSFNNVGYTTLYSGENSSYTSVTGINLNDDYNKYDFLIFEFKEVTDSSNWLARDMIPNFGLAGGLSRYGLKFYFLATSGYTTVTFDGGNTKKIYFNDSYGTGMVLMAIYGYIKRGEE